MKLFWRALACASVITVFIGHVAMSQSRYQVKWQNISGGGNTGVSPGFKVSPNIGNAVVGTGESPSFNIQYETGEVTEEFLPTAIEEPEVIPDIETVTYLDHNYPNPFNPSTTIRYGLRSRTHVSLKVYNVMGQLVKTLVNETKNSGDYTIVWRGVNNTGESVASGVYFYRLIAGAFSHTKKMVLLK
jgi:hypothetical protein